MTIISLQRLSYKLILKLVGIFKKFVNFNDKKSKIIRFQKIKPFGPRKKPLSSQIQCAHLKKKKKGFYVIGDRLKLLCQFNTMPHSQTIFLDAANVL